MGWMRARGLFVCLGAGRMRRRLRVWFVPDGRAFQEEPTKSAESRAAGRSADCKPTQPDMLGPFYEPGAPVRTRVGSGYVLSGAVLAAEECKPIPSARIEFWLANPRGEYDDAHRATVFAGQRGEYRFQSNVPVSYGGRPPHIHVRVSAPGYRDLVTQHYPDAGHIEASFDLVLVAQ